MSNPFLILSDSPTTPTNPYSTSSSKEMTMAQDSITSSHLYKDVLELILLCTVNEQPSLSSIYLADLAVSVTDHWDKNLIEQALFERLRMANPSTQLLSKGKSSSTKEDIPSVTEQRCLHYLAGCYHRLLRQRDHFKSILNDTQQLFIEHSKTAIILPDLYEGQDLSKQWLELLVDGLENTPIAEFTDRINNEFFPSASDQVELMYTAVFRHMYKAIQPLDYFSTELMSYIALLTRLAAWPQLVRIIFRLSHPKSTSQRSHRNPNVPSGGGRSFEDTLVGSLLSKSCLPSQPNQPFLFFDKPKSMSERDVEITASTMWQPMRTYQDSLSQLFLAFVKNATVRNDVLKWLGDCLMENRGKNKEWSSHNPLTAYIFVSDGFFLNLNMILLNLARPFAEPYSPKLLKIHPLYAVSENEHVHLKGLNKDTPLIVRDESIPPENDENVTFNFITEIFFMSHLSYSCAVHRLHRLLLKINEELSRVQQAYNDASRTQGANRDDVQRLEQTMEKGLTAFLNIKTVLNEPHLLELSNALLNATCSWLVHLASTSNQAQYEEKISKDIQLPLTSPPNRYLSYIPEFIVENVNNFLSFLGRFNVRLFESLNPSVNEYVTMILVFMGDARRLRNPHLRAGLAEALEAILPNKQHGGGRTLNSSFAESIFTTHPLIEHLPRVLLDVFVSIELTGQAVAFEQKFNYRRPMYEILEYLWKFDKHRAQVKKLAVYAEEHIEDAEAPLFLRFISLLRNDANFLLDEALTQMTRLKENQEARDRGDWNSIPDQQRQDLENTFRHTGQTARYTNFMGLKTLIILDMITSESQSIFCHPAISGQLSAMLNYFLQQLVGPKRRNLKVRDANEYQFDPSKLVAKVTDIYLNFANREEFSAAICNDGMSYNEHLFPQAVEVLERIGYPPEKIQAFLQLGEHIKMIAAEHKEEDAVYDDAPDDYLDPITSTLMIEPVMLPSSRQIVDRATIARHLLSDQTDPFNRNPLRMQDVVPQLELKQAIEQWKLSRREQ